METTILIGEKTFSPKAMDRLRAYGRVLEFGSPKQFLKNLPKAQVVLAALDLKLEKPVLERAVGLKLIGSRTTQLRYIDLETCRKRGIKVVNIKADSPVLQKTPSTAEETMALIFALLRKIPWAFDSIKTEKWMRTEYCGTEFSGKLVGLIGFGRLGKMVAHFCYALGARVMAHDPHISAGEMEKTGCSKVSLDRLLRTSDIISVHSIYDQSTHKLLSAEQFGKMKKGVFFINTARGEITDEKALLEALRSGRLAGAAVDTLSGESPDGKHLKNNPLVQWAKKNQNLLIVPHLGGATIEAIRRTQEYITDLVIKELKNQNSRKTGQASW